MVRGGAAQKARLIHARQDQSSGRIDAVFESDTEWSGKILRVIALEGKNLIFLNSHMGIYFENREVLGWLARGLLLHWRGELPKRTQ